MSSPKITWDALYLGKECVHIVHIDDTASVYLLGTNHVSEFSARNARKLIRQVNPDVVAVELCRRRLEDANQFGGDPNFDKRYQELERIPKHWRKRAAAEMIRLRLTTMAMEHYKQLSPAARRSAKGVQRSSSTVEELVQQQRFSSFRLKRRGYLIRPVRVREVCIAGDIFAPFQDQVWYLESNRSNVLYSPQVSYKIVMTDLPIERTYARLMSALRKEEKRMIRQYENSFVKSFLKDKTGIMGRIWRSNAKISDVMIGERNRYLAYGLLKAMQAAPKTCDSQRTVQVVGLVGRRHVNGIIKIWKSDRMQKWLANILKY